ncbi:MAG: DUF1566 domain-containing protein [Candidatus Paceibacterota bacterium]|jgi:hypothetical protein
MQYKNKTTGELIDLDNFEEVKEPLDGFKNSVKQVIEGKTLEWGEVSDREMDWFEAKAWCEERGGRLPTRVELLQAFDEKVEGFQGFYFWSSTEYYNNTALAWPVNLASGYTNFNTKTNSGYVRCVR